MKLRKKFIEKGTHMRCPKCGDEGRLSNLAIWSLENIGRIPCSDCMYNITRDDVLNYIKPKLSGD